MTLVLVALVVALSVILTRPHPHAPLIVRGGHSLAPTIGPLPTLPPG